MKIGRYSHQTTVRDALGPLRYFGACDVCRGQFMQGDERVYVYGEAGSRAWLCSRCHAKVRHEATRA